MTITNMNSHHAKCAKECLNFESQWYIIPLYVKNPTQEMNEKSQFFEGVQAIAYLSDETKIDNEIIVYLIVIININPYVVLYIYYKHMWVYIYDCNLPMKGTEKQHKKSLYFKYSLIIVKCFS